MTVWPTDWPNVSFGPLAGLWAKDPVNAESPCGARALGPWARRVSNLRPLACEASTRTPLDGRPKGHAPNVCKGSRRLGRLPVEVSERPNEGRSGHVWPNEWPNGPRAVGA
jgi:hypothetical protein